MNDYVVNSKPSKEPDERLLREGGGRGGWHLLLVSGFCLVAQLPISPLTATYGKIIETKAHDQVVIVVCP